MIRLRAENAVAPHSSVYEIAINIGAGMAQLVFLHGPGAGGCAEAFRYQLEHFSDSIAPNLPGHLSGTPCSSVQRYTDWLRGWLWAQGHERDLVLVGFTLG